MVLEWEGGGGQNFEKNTICLGLVLLGYANLGGFFFGVYHFLQVFFFFFWGGGCQFSK